MIDTDKYEGHSTGWKLKMNNSSATIWNDEGHKVATTHYYDSPSNRHDRFIIEDSLKLLAEVKRLREEITALNKWADNVREFFGDEAMIDLYDIYGGEEE